MKKLEEDTMKITVTEIITKQEENQGKIKVLRKFNFFSFTKGD